MDKTPFETKLRTPEGWKPITNDLYITLRFICKSIIKKKKKKGKKKKKKKYHHSIGW